MSAPVPLPGSVSVNAIGDVAGDGGHDELLALLVVACGSIDRQMPLTTCTIIRMDACEREKTSISSIHCAKPRPAPP